MTPTFLPQGFRTFDVGSRDEVVRIASGKPADDLDVMASARGGQSGAATTPADVNVAGTEPL